MILENSYKVTEFELQAELYMYLKNKWLEVRWEIVDTYIKQETLNRKWYRQCRFDLVIFNNWVWKVIIEVKKPWKDINKNTRQNMKYKMYNLPLLYINNSKNIENIYKEVIACIY